MKLDRWHDPLKENLNHAGLTNILNSHPGKVHMKKMKRQAKGQRMLSMAKTPSTTPQWWRCVIIYLSEPTESAPPRVNYNIKCILWVNTTH